MRNSALEKIHLESDILKKALSMPKKIKELDISPKTIDDLKNDGHYEMFSAIKENINYIIEYSLICDEPIFLINNFSSEEKAYFSECQFYKDILAMLEYKKEARSVIY